VGRFASLSMAIRLPCPVGKDRRGHIDRGAGLWDWISGPACRCAETNRGHAAHAASNTPAHGLIGCSSQRRRVIWSSGSAILCNTLMSRSPDFALRRIDSASKATWEEATGSG